MPKPIPPADDAPQAEHKKHALEVLGWHAYKERPKDMPGNDDVRPFKDNDKKP